jgi:hypothetical protein
MCKLRRRKCPNARSSHPEPCQDNRGLWRIGVQDFEDFITEAYRQTADSIASGAGELLVADANAAGR